jgi:hypothetical protein
MASEKNKAGEKTKLTLSKPITAHGQTISHLEFRAPSGEDILEIGAPPFIIDKKERTHIDFAVTGDYIVRLAEIPPSSVKLMAPIDLMAAFGVVAGFFGASETTRKKSSDTTTD